MASQALAKGALWMQNVDYPAIWDRALIDALYASEGVINGFAVTANGGLGIAVSAGAAVIQGDEIANQGKYLIDNDAVVTLTVASVGTTRTEYVYIAVNDPSVASGRAGDNVSIETSTTAPPDSALLIATLELPGGTATITSGMITDNRVYADVVAPGSVTTAKLVDSSVTTAKLADSSVTSAKIVNGTIATADIADGAVTLAKLEATLQATLDTIDPADAIIAVGGVTAPPGYVLCDGSTYSRTTYAATFARLNAAGLPYGAGDGANTFHVPDLQSKFVAGKGTAGWSNALTDTGGSKDAISVTHTHDQAHNHSFIHDHPDNISASSSQGSHSHADVAGTNGYVFWANDYGSGSATVEWPTASGMPASYVKWGLTWATSTPSASAGTITTTISGTVNNNPSSDKTTLQSSTITTNQNPDGGVGTDKNLPPYQTLTYCIRMR